MDDLVAEQARYLHDTIRLMKRRFPQPGTFRREDVNGCMASSCDLTLPQLHTLVTCHELGPATIKDIAASLEVSAPSASSMVDRLVELGALTREQSDRDRRQVVVRLSESGLATVIEMEEYMLNGLAEVLQRIGPEYARMWCEVYEEINRVFGETEKVDVAGRQGVAQ